MSETLRIHADENMSELDAFAAFGRVTPFAGRALCQADLAATDILLVRSVTRVDAALLAGTPVRFVGSATIGTDHVDLDWLACQGIAFAHAPGCNAMAVAEYVTRTLLAWCEREGRAPQGLSLGVVGLGHVGSRVAAIAAALGLRIMPCDPPRQEAGDSCAWPWVGLGQALACDVVSLHVPLVHAGRHPSVHLLGAAELERLDAGQLLLNTSRGAVVDNAALLQRLRRPAAPACVLDVWEGEPRVPRPLFERVWRGSPHIAGYSHEGKLRGSLMLHAALARFLGRAVESPGLPCLGEREWPVQAWPQLLELLRQTWSAQADHRRLRASLDEADPARAFDALRKHYPLRHELAAWHWQAPPDEANPALRQSLLGVEADS